MATTISSGFDRLLSNLTPSTVESEAFKSHRNSVADKLKNSFGVTNFFRTGSNGNGTSVRYYSDVDFFASIPGYAQQQDSAYMLRKVKEALQLRFPPTDFHIDTPAVVCLFGNDGAEKIEVVPAYYTGRDSGDNHNVYKIPELGGGWMKSAPGVHNAYVTTENKRLDGKLKQLIRLTKSIKYYNGIPISSFYLELRVTKWAEKETGILYSYDVRSVLKHLVDCQLAQMVDPMGVSGYVPAANTENYRRDALSKLTMALNRANHAREAEDAGKIATAFEYWDKVFSGNFPAYG